MSNQPPATSPQPRQCLGPDCLNTFVPPETAPHKKFCSERCRNKFHGQELKQVRAEVRQRRKEQQP